MTAAPLNAFFVEGVAFWAPTLPGWPIARAAFRGEGSAVDPPAKRPAPEVLAAAERRRAPDTVALALEVAAAAVHASGHAPGTLPSIFTSAHGDLGVNDYMCRTLATQPTLISPTKFHNAVHNASAGYWTIGTACREASTALTAFDASFAAGLLEAATQCAADARPVLLVAFDVEASGPLASVTTSRGLLAGAIVIAPAPGERSVAGFEWSLSSTGSAGSTNAAGSASAAAPAALCSEAARALAGNAMADALPFFEALARPGADIVLPLSASLALCLRPRPFATLRGARQA